MRQYDKVELGKISLKYGFVRDTFEKVLRLKDILMYFNEQDYLKENLALKGGTAINLAVFDLPRLSVDIDMDYTANDTKEHMLIARERISMLVKNYMEREGYQLSTTSRFRHSLDAFHYNYENAGGNKDMIKIEINYSLRSHIFNPIDKKILTNVFDDDMSIRMLEPMEIFAAKGNALINRAAARDLYDWSNMIRNNLFSSESDLFRKCFAFYTTISADQNDINRYFNTDLIESLTFTKIRRDLFPVICKKDNFDLIKRKNQAKDYIAELMQLTDKENEYMDRFIKKEYKPGLLFEDDEIVERLRNHPMALWKCKH